MTNSGKNEKDTLFDYMSNQFSAHANILIGLSVLLFTFFTFVATTGYFPRVRIVSLNFSNIFAKATVDYIVIFLILLFLMFGTIFTLFRMVFYGAFSSALIELSESQDSSLKLRETANNKLWKENVKFLGIFPIRYWSTGLSVSRKSFWVSMLVSLVATTILFVVFFLE
jgi:hypothetical protein